MNEDLERILDKMWPDIWKDFNCPALTKPKILPAGQEGEVGTARFVWDGKETEISEKFLRENAASMSLESKLKVLVNHEVGHWCLFPRELSTSIYLLAQADSWGPKASMLWGYYADICNESALIKEGLLGKDVLEFRRELVEESLNAKGKKAELSQANASIYNLMIATYVHTFPNISKFPDLTKKEKEHWERMKGISFLNETLDEHTASFYRFYKALEDLIEDPHSQTGNAPHDLQEIPEKDINKALSKILKERGKYSYDVAKKYIAKIRPDVLDPYVPAKNIQKGIGSESSDFHLNDDLIQVYKRWAAQYGVYIIKRPIEKDKTSTFRQGVREYEIGDSIQKIDIFGSRGIIGIPGITKLHLEEEGVLPSMDWEIPHLNLGIDSSGSMADPRSSGGAIQVLTAAIIGNNYHANGAHVGAWNFSTDIVFLEPQRNLDSFYSVVCGYWGGGTVLNTKKLMEFLGRMKLHQDRDFLHQSAYPERDLASLVPEENRRYFMDKNLEVKIKKVSANCRRLDNVLITDGYIGNAEEVIEHLSTLGQITRNFVFLTNEEKYSEWNGLNIPNTFVYPATKPDDLISLALGRSKKLGDYSVKEAGRK